MSLKPEQPDAMPAFICTTCGTQHADSNEPPSGCRICQDDRQYVGLGGQHWTTQDALAETHENHVEELEPGLWSVETRPAFGIGQSAHLLRHAGGTILWDCVSLIDQETADRIAELGGVDAIAVSHPHFYSSIVDWSEAFGGVPIYLHNDDARWVCRPDPRITFWAGDTYPVGDGVDADPLRRALRRINAAALGGRRGRPRRAARQRHSEGGLGSRVGQRDAQLSESHSCWAVSAQSGGSCAPAAPLRPHLRRLDETRDSRERARHRREIVCTVSSGDCGVKSAQKQPRPGGERHPAGTASQGDGLGN